MEKKGFTLIELMVVILIVGILAAVAIPILRARIESGKKVEAEKLRRVGTVDPNIKKVVFRGEMEGKKYTFFWCIGNYCKLNLEEPNGMSFEIWDNDDSLVVGDSEYDEYKISTEGSETVFKKGHMMERATKMLQEWQPRIMKKHWSEALVKHRYLKP